MVVVATLPDTLPMPTIQLVDTSGCGSFEPTHNSRNRLAAGRRRLSPRITHEAQYGVNVVGHYHENVQLNSREMKRDSAPAFLHHSARTAQTRPATLNPTEKACPTEGADRHEVRALLRVVKARDAWRHATDAVRRRPRIRLPIHSAHCTGDAPGKKDAAAAKHATGEACHRPYITSQPPPPGDIRWTLGPVGASRNGRGLPLPYNRGSPTGSTALSACGLCPRRPPASGRRGRRPPLPASAHCVSSRHSPWPPRLPASARRR